MYDNFATQTSNFVRENISLAQGVICTALASGTNAAPHDNRVKTYLRQVLVEKCGFLVTYGSRADLRVFLLSHIA